jgi:CRP-like cAMP-binding protein
MIPDPKNNDLGFDSFRKTLRQLITISETEMLQLERKCHRKSILKKEYLSVEHQSVNEVFFVLSGLVRVTIVDREGREHTSHFSKESEFIADYGSFLTQNKAVYHLQALEDTEVIVMQRSAIEWGYKHMQEGEKLGRAIAESYYIYLDTRIQRQYTLTAMQRYELMNETFPNIHNRVPQHMIASYLGITPIHLSRIKKAELIKA